MTISYYYNNLTQIEFGPGSRRTIADKIKTLGGSKAMVVTDKGVSEAGLLEMVLPGIREAGLDCLTFDGVKQDPSTEVIGEIFELFKSSNADILVAVGGGSSIDAAKGVSLLTANPGPLRQYGGVGKVGAKGRPLIAVPTTAGTGSEVTLFAVLSDLAADLKFTVTSTHVAPDVAVLDPELTLTLPPSLTASTGLDAITHAVEAFTSRISQPITDALALESLRLFYRWLPVAVNSGQNLEARTMVLQAELMAGIAFNNAFLGLCHAIASPLGAHFHVPHGLANAIMLPYVMEYNYPAAAEKYARLADVFGRVPKGDIYQRAKDAVGAMSNFVVLCGLPRKLRDVNAKKELLDKVAEDALLSVQLKFNCRKASVKDIRQILETAF
ncbi:MAG: iron-containing alcohol dehydrogenase [Deltaproteobacteria bacterium]|nr:iron-containing alcohol dehydrogenase [Deltaproteobacteria bacterium]